MAYYDFSRFLDTVKRFDNLSDAVAYAERACERVDLAHRKLRSQAAQSRDNGIQYRGFIGGFLYYIKYEGTATYSSPSEFDDFKSIVDHFKKKP